uniref:S1 motif domain-containing protein n=1 Tax=Prasinoderma singulare TaxID=676789 RepID=A0A7S3FDB2_9VIRI
MADFIVDGDEELGPDGRPVRRRKRKKRRAPAGTAHVSSDQLQEAHDLFGNADQMLEMYNAQRARAAAGVEAAGEHEDEMDEDAGATGRSTMDALEPAVRDQYFMGERDQKMIRRDVPERVQERMQSSVLEKERFRQAPSQTDLALEAQWIYESVFAPNAPEYSLYYRLGHPQPKMARYMTAEERLAEPREERDIFEEYEGIRRAAVTAAIQKVVRLLLEERLEVPTIAMWRSAECGVLAEELSKGELDEAEEAVRTQLRSVDAGPYDYRTLARWRALHRVAEMDRRWGVIQARKANQLHAVEGLAEAAKEAATLEGRELSAMEEVAMRARAERVKEALSAARTPEEVGDAEALAAVVLADSVVSWDDISQAGKAVGVRKLRPIAKTAYDRQIQAGVAPLADKLFSAREVGDDFASGVRDMAREVDDPELPPAELAREDFVSPGEADDRAELAASRALEGARLVAAQRLAAHPAVRQKLRETYYAEAVVTTQPTSSSVDAKIDSYHALGPVKWLHEKPARLLMTWDDRATTDFENAVFQPAMNGGGTVEVPMPEGPLLIEQGVKAKQLQVTYMLPEHVMARVREELRELGGYLSDGESAVAQAWNEEREKAVEQALQMLLAAFERDLKQRMLAVSRDYVAAKVGDAFWEMVSNAPAHHGVQMSDDSSHCTYERNARVMAVVGGDTTEDPIVCAICDETGELSEMVTLPALAHQLRRDEQDNAHFPGPNDSVMLTKWRADFYRCVEFMRVNEPQIVAVGASSRRARALFGVINQVTEKLVELHPHEAAENLMTYVVDQRLASMMAQTKLMASEMAEHEERTRVAVALCRCLQDPAAAGAAVVAERDVASLLKLHKLQAHVPAEDRVDMLTQCMLSVVTQVGVDVNLMNAHPWRAPPLQFVAGLGARKAKKLLDLCRAHGPLLKRMDLIVTPDNPSPLACMGDVVFINACSALRVDKRTVDTYSTSYDEHDPFDDSRNTHEHYDLVGKVAADAVLLLRIQEAGENEVTETPGAEEALRELLESHEDKEADGRRRDLLKALWDLDLEAIEFYEAANPNAGPQPTYEAWAEAHPLDDLDDDDARIAAFERELHAWRATKDAFSARARLARAELTWPYGELRPPFRYPGQGTADGPRELFKLQLGDEWETFKYGRVVEGVVKYLADGFAKVDLGHEMVTCMIGRNYVSSHEVESVKECKLQVRKAVVCRVREVDMEDFKVELTCRTADINDNKTFERALEAELPHRFDRHWTAQKTVRDMWRAAGIKEKPKFIPRRIAHPFFRNCSRDEAIEGLRKKAVGEVALRPSSKGTDHLSLTYKVCPGVFADMDIIEGGKKKDEVGRQTAQHLVLGKPLKVDGMEYSDLDELMAHHIEPVVQRIKDAINYRKFMKLTTKTEVDQRLLDQKRQNPAMVAYCFALPGGDRSGLLMLAYVLNQNPRHEYITLTPRGFTYRERNYSKLDDVVKEFKRNPNVAPAPEPLQAPAAQVQVPPAHDAYGGAWEQQGNYGPPAASAAGGYADGGSNYGGAYTAAGTGNYGGAYQQPAPPPPVQPAYAAGGDYGNYGPPPSNYAPQAGGYGNYGPPPSAPPPGAPPPPPPPPGGPHGPPPNAPPPPPPPGPPAHYAY